MKVILFGASGMVGTGVVLECLDDPRVSEVLVIGRRSCVRSSPKLTEILKQDVSDLTDLEPRLAGYDACFFCLGVSAAGMSEADYTRLTYDLTMAVAASLARLNPGMTFCYVTGQGTDSTEKGRFMWARVKGRTENALLRLPFKAAYMFRPGYIQPLRGTTSSTTLYRALYAVVAPLYPLLERIASKQLTTTVKVGKAMIEAAAGGAPKSVLEVSDINALAARSG
ncbi:MAG: epimerase [Gemmatimonadota bacterium]